MSIAISKPAQLHESPRQPRLASLTLGAIGVVFGDIGTSPLYAFRECLRGPHGVTPTPANVLGVLSLIIWALTLVVTVKYLSFSLLARNARPLDAYFGIPPGKVFEVGAQFDL